MEALSTDCMFLRVNRHLFWSHLCGKGARLQEGDVPYVVAGTAKLVRDLGYERFCLHGDKEGVHQLLLDKVGKECRREGQDWQILRHV